MRYYDKMQRYSGCSGCPGGLGASWLDWLFRPAVAAGMEYGDALKKQAEEKQAAEAAIAQQGATPELQARVAAAEAEIARLKAQQPQQAGINWFGVGVLGLGAYFLFFRKKR